VRGTSRAAVAGVTAVACLTFVGTAAAFGPEPAPAVEEAPTLATPALAPEPAPAIDAEPVSASAAEAQASRNVVSEQYQSRDIESSAPSTEAAGAAREIARDSATSAHQTDAIPNADPVEAAMEQGLVAPEPVEPNLERAISRAAAIRTSEADTGSAWYRERELQYQSVPSAARLARMSDDAIPARLSAESSPKRAWIARDTATSNPTACPSPDCGPSKIARHLIRLLEKGVAPTEARLLVKRAADESSKGSSAGAGRATDASTAAAGIPTAAVGIAAEAAGTLASTAPQMAAKAEMAARAVIAPKAARAAIVRPLRRALPTLPRPPSGEPLTDTRRLVQIGLLLGMVYVAFLTFWFWVTRVRGRRAGGIPF
jgi:hypothetical protein